MVERSDLRKEQISNDEEEQRAAYKDVVVVFVDSSEGAGACFCDCM